ncbi:MAG: hypothetical protein MZU79_01690 [Anaerotruncus sp.]|nr:hypothetical protein [Anaerotruncus sp.]
MISLMLYGSAAGGSYVKGKSDINILVVLTPDGINRLEDGFGHGETMEKAPCGCAAGYDKAVY